LHSIILSSSQQQELGTVAIGFGILLLSAFYTWANIVGLKKQIKQFIIEDPSTNIGNQSEVIEQLILIISIILIFLGEYLILKSYDEPLIIDLEQNYIDIIELNSIALIIGGIIGGIIGYYFSNVPTTQFKRKRARISGSLFSSAGLLGLLSVYEDTQ
jgi:hypothetical protein